ncbi:MAG: 50S ribosomal protein L6 [Chloroflexi bacterium]|nr:50S ribosomal protein L6 [Chloroflexota bacterium]
MSRVGRAPIVLPKGVQAKIEGSSITIKGPKGELRREIHPAFKVELKDGTLTVIAPQDSLYDALHGLTRALLNNMATGVTNGFKRELEIEGVGYRAELTGKNLVLSLGFSHTVTIEPPSGISFVVDKNQRLFSVEGVDREAVGQMAARLRTIRPPEPYKGKGIHYLGEHIRRKAGKAGKVGAAGAKL